MTLLFIGMSDRMACLEPIASEIRLQPFAIRIDTIDYWRRPKVLLAGASQVPESLSTLVTALNEGARSCDFTPETRPYRPHVTLSRRSMPVETLRIEPIDWHVDEFCLAWSRDGIGTPRYQSVARWKLAVERGDDAGSNQPLS